MQLSIEVLLTIAGLLILLGTNLFIMARTFGSQQQLLKSHEEYHRKHFETANDHGKKLQIHETKLALHEARLGDRT